MYGIVDLSPEITDPCPHTMPYFEQEDLLLLPEITFDFAEKEKSTQFVSTERSTLKCMR